MAYHSVTVEPAGLDLRYIPNVEYAKYGDISRSLQMIVPWWSEKKLPLIVYLPGSAFYEQDMQSSVPGCCALARRGFAVAMLQYRGSQIAKFPAQVQDVHNALTFLKAHAEEYFIDFDRVFLMGHSSGGYNALMAALTAGLSEFDGGAGHAIRGVIPVSAPCCLKFEMGMTVPGKISYNPDDYRPELDMLGLARFEDDPQLCHRARPDTYISRCDTPVLLIHGNRDQTVYLDNSRDFYNALTAAGKSAEFYEMDGQDHGGPWLFDDKTLDIVTGFIGELL